MSRAAIICPIYTAEDVDLDEIDFQYFASPKQD